MRLAGAESIFSDRAGVEDIQNAFADDDRRGEFIILSQGEQAYIQASGENDGPYTLEYRDGDNDHHFQCIRELSKSEVQSAFVKYLKGDSSWKTDFEWKKMAFKPGWKFW